MIGNGVSWWKRQLKYRLEQMLSSWCFNFRVTQMIQPMKIRKRFAANINSFHSYCLLWKLLDKVNRAGRTFKMRFLTSLILILCWILGGHYISRIYDMYTPFTVGLIYLMYRTFEQIAVFKPESSLPASSEKYIICKWKKSDGQCTEISNYLSECHKVDWLTRRNLKRAQEDFAEIVHLLNPRRLQESFRFYNYIRQSNIE
jgi:hypothetical protein